MPPKIYPNSTGSLNPAANSPPKEAAASTVTKSTIKRKSSCTDQATKYKVIKIIKISLFTLVDLYGSFQATIR